MIKRNKLTDTIYEAVVYFLERDGKPPSLRMLAEHCFVSHTTVIAHLSRLEGMGWIEREYGQPRSICLGPNAPHQQNVSKKQV